MASSGFLLLLPFFFLFSSPSLAQGPRALVLPVAKDAAALQYVTRVYLGTPWVAVKLVVDLGGRILWVDCGSGYVSSTYRPVRCGSAACSLANATACGDSFTSPHRPPRDNTTCGVSVENTITHNSTAGEIAEDVLTVPSVEVSNTSLGPYATDPSFVFSCAQNSLLQGLAAGARGMAGLGRTSVALPTQLAAEFGFDRKFAVCLSSTSSDGVILLGDEPYNFLPAVNASASLIYTPLVIAQGKDDSDDYFIGVTSIKINGTAVPLNATARLLAKISTVSPYTVLETSVYTAVTEAFGAATSSVIPRVAPVAPFGLCFNSTYVGSTRVGPAVPTVDLVLQSESVFWRMFGANSMVQARDDVLCLGFVDGGASPEAAIVLGGHQLEDNLVQFDLAALRLGFTSSLLFLQTSCADFSFAGSRA